jgi:sec-independent protein translocase protein TatC
MTRNRSPMGEMPFLDHLEELRWRILWSLLAIGVGAVIGFIAVQEFQAMELLMRPLRDTLDADLRLIYLNPVDGFFITLKLGLLVGLILAAPVVIYQIWAFLSPALEPQEKKMIIPALYLGTVLFMAGVALAYFVVLPLTLVFFSQFQEEFLVAQYEANRTIGFITRLLLAFGVAFELPVVVMIFTAMGLVTPRFLREKRRYAIVAITILASLLTPGDLASTFMMIVPLLILYEGSILLAALISRRRTSELDQETPTPDAEAPEGAVEVRG